MAARNSIFPSSILPFRDHAVLLIAPITPLVGSTSFSLSLLSLPHERFSPASRSTKAGYPDGGASLPSAGSRTSRGRTALERLGRVASDRRERCSLGSVSDHSIYSTPSPPSGKGLSQSSQDGDSMDQFPTETHHYSRHITNTFPFFTDNRCREGGLLDRTLDLYLAFRSTARWPARNWSQ